VELAARGTSGAPYPWGGAGPSCAQAATLVRDGTASSCAGKRPSKVATHPMGTSPYGVHDMSGNVEEWVADWYVDSPGTAPRAGSSHVLRGGGWLSGPSQSRGTSRNWGSALEAGPNVGFRCARDATEAVGPDAGVVEAPRDGGR
jgi:formylglycine-generating enzyme required for sulfatase activity